MKAMRCSTNQPMPPSRPVQATTDRRGAEPCGRRGASLGTSTHRVAAHAEPRTSSSVMMASPWRQAIVRPEVRDQCEYGGAEAEEDGDQCRTADGQPGGSDALWKQALDDGDGNKHTPHHVIPAHDDGPEPVDTERPAEDGVTAHAYRIEDRLQRQSSMKANARPSNAIPHQFMPSRRATSRIRTTPAP